MTIIVIYYEKTKNLPCAVVSGCWFDSCSAVHPPSGERTGGRGGRTEETAPWRKHRHCCVSRLKSAVHRKHAPPVSPAPPYLLLFDLVVTPNVMSGTTTPPAGCLGGWCLVLAPPPLARYWFSSLQVTTPAFAASRFRDTKSGSDGRWEAEFSCLNWTLQPDRTEPDTEMKDTIHTHAVKVNQKKYIYLYRCVSSGPDWTLQWAGFGPHAIGLTPLFCYVYITVNTDP